MIKTKPELLIGGIYTDERGELLYNNNFDLTPVKRMYIIRHPDTSVVRAWQGHQQEHKYFQCIKGSFVVAWKKIDDFARPNMNFDAEYVILSDSENKVLSVPAGYANGLKALIPGSEIMVFSDHALGASLDDKIRFNKDWWLDWSRFD